MSLTRRRFTRVLASAGAALAFRRWADAQTVQPIAGGRLVATAPLGRFDGRATPPLNVLLGTELVRIVGNDLLPSGAPWGANTTHVLGAAIPQARIAAAVVALVLLAVFYVAFTRSK